MVALSKTVITTYGRELVPSRQSDLVVDPDLVIARRRRVGDDGHPRNGSSSRSSGARWRSGFAWGGSADSCRRAYPCGHWYRPSAAENPHGAWYVKTSIPTSVPSATPTRGERRPRFHSTVPNLSD
jgi:hypothetical protein